MRGTETGSRLQTASEHYRTRSESYQGKRVSAGGRMRHGRPQEGNGRRERRRLRQLTVSGILLVIVIAVKLTMPGLVGQYKEKLMEVLCENTDFVAAFSSVGRVFSGEDGVGELLNDAYVAVFGPSKETAQQTSQHIELPALEDEEHTDASKRAEETVYSAANMPADACLTQQVLDFDYLPPLEEPELSSPFGYRDHPIDGENRFHYGLDLAAEEGEVIGSFAAGTVSAVGESSDLGKYVTVAHEGGYTSLYAHCSRVTASSGQQMQAGDPIAEVGQTGQATGPHLHFELHREGIYLNPIYYVCS